MSYRWFQGSGEVAARESPRYAGLDSLEDPRGYIADPELVAAVNVAVTLGQPLLVTGEPGVGKSLLAHRIAFEMGHREPLVAIARTDSTANELFYQFDALLRFLDVQNRQTDRAADLSNYVTYRALGLAILLALPEEMSRRYQPFLPPQWRGMSAVRPVVLIDEIDKAPRELPNDILNEVERMEFFIREAGEVVPDFTGEERRLRESGLSPEDARAKVEGYRQEFQSRRPILVLTSNDEKRLPDAFLRRCVYYHIPFPTAERLRQILTRRLAGDSAGGPGYQDEAHLKAAVDLFSVLRERVHDRKPSTAELIGWMRVLLREGVTTDELKALRQPRSGVTDAAARKLAPSLSLLAKSKEDAVQLCQFLGLPDPAGDSGGG